MRLARAALFLVTLLGSARVHATTSSCAGATDGTSCIDACVFGTCLMGVCKGTNRPDGTPCSTDNPCTNDDQCQAGLCVAGAAVVCPDQSACLVGVCSPRIGCTFKDVCPPDLAGQDNDLAGADLEAPDLAGPDMCTVPEGSEVFSCDNPPDGFFFGSDLGGDASAEAFHVRGSRIGDCAFGGGELGGPVGVFVLLLGLAALARRRPA